MTDSTNTIAAAAKTVAERRANWEQKGWEFYQAADGYWAGRNGDSAVGPAMRITALFEALERREEVANENKWQAMLAARAEYERLGWQFTYGKDGVYATREEGRKTEKAGPAEGIAELLALMAPQNDETPAETETTADVAPDAVGESAEETAPDTRTPEERRNDVLAHLVENYFSRAELEYAADMEPPKGETYLCKSAKEDKRGGSGGGIGYATVGNKVLVGWPVEFEFTIVSLAKAAFERHLRLVASESFANDVDGGPVQTAAAVVAVDTESGVVEVNGVAVDSLEGALRPVVEKALDEVIGDGDHDDAETGGHSDEPRFADDRLPDTKVIKCRCDLTDHEVLAKTNQLMENYRILDAKQAEFDNLKKLYKKNFEELQKEADELVYAIGNRVEYRPLECSLEYDRMKGVVLAYRPDTGEQVDRRSMTPEEMRIASQMKLF